MTLNQLIYACIWLFIFLCGVVAIGMTFYLGRSKVKFIDRLAYGYEIEDDSIFFKIMRIPHYGGAFAWYFYARRCHLLEIREHFDKKFQLPFIITFYVGWTGAIGIAVLYVLDKLFLHVTE